MFRENEWLFSTFEGRKELSTSVAYQRLLVVTLSRGHIYLNVDEVKAELSAKVMEVAPPNTSEKDVCSINIYTCTSSFQSTVKMHTKCMYIYVYIT